jgi:ABC-2 type transport system ATP-binding protein
MNDLTVSKTTIIRCSGLSKLFGARPLGHVDLELGRAASSACWPQRSGKTTLIKLLCGLLQARSGFPLIDGREPGFYTKSVTSFLRNGCILPTGCAPGIWWTLFRRLLCDFEPQKEHSHVRRLGIGPGIA